MKTLNLTIKTLDQKEYNISLPEDATVDFLKTEISKLSDGYPEYSQRLIWMGKQLEDGRYLNEYNITDKSTIHLIIKNYSKIQSTNLKTLRIKNSGAGDVYIINLEEDVTVRDLKTLISKACYNPISMQKLVYKGQTLKDEQYLSTYNIQDSDTIYASIQISQEYQTYKFTQNNQKNDSGSWKTIAGSGIITCSLPIGVILGVCAYYAEPIFTPGYLIGVGTCVIASVIGVSMIIYDCNNRTI